MPQGDLTPATPTPIDPNVISTSHYMIVDVAKLDSAISETANAIREKTGSSDNISWDMDNGFAEPIANMEVSSEPELTMDTADVVLLKPFTLPPILYTIDDFLELEELPDLNSDPEIQSICNELGIDSFEWNWSLQDAKAVISSKIVKNEQLVIGAIANGPAMMLDFVISNKHTAQLPIYIGYGIDGSSTVAIMAFDEGKVVQRTVSGTSINYPHFAEEFQVTYDNEYLVKITSTVPIRASGIDGCEALINVENKRPIYGQYIDTIVLGSCTNGVVDTVIGQYAFNNCAIDNITLPHGITEIGLYAFANCDYLEFISLPNTVTTIGDYAFENCKNLKKIYIPDGVTSIGRGAFSGCANLEYVHIPNTVTTIGDYAFENCANLKYISIPSSVQSIGKYAFSECYCLDYCEFLFVNNAFKTISEGMFSDCKNLKNIDIPVTVNSIGIGAFSGCESLQSIIIPESVNIINSVAFYNCTNMINVEFQTTDSTHPRIYDNAFSNCTSLINVKILSSDPPLNADADAFKNVPDDCVFECPEGSEDLYRNATGWSYFFEDHSGGGSIM